MRNQRYRVNGESVHEGARRLVLLLVCVMLSAPVFFSVCAHGLSQKVVRVGWYDSPFNFTNAYGRRSGYAYEYQQKIAAYTGWRYEYVEGSWPELLEMLKRGKSTC